VLPEEPGTQATVRMFWELVELIKKHDGGEEMEYAIADLELKISRRVVNGDDVYRVAGFIDSLAGSVYRVLDDMAEK